MTRYIRTTADRDPYIRPGFYWHCFSHMFTTTISIELRERMLRLKEEDEKQSQKKYGG